MSATTVTTKLNCPECRRENEPERIYCHDCGSRLDRAALVKEKPKTEDPKVTHKRMQSFFDPRRAKMRLALTTIGKVILGALVAATVVQMLRAPDLPAAAKTTVLPPQINLDLENASMDPRSAPLRYSEEQVNAYLAYSLRGKRANMSKPLQFERVVVGFDEGSTRVTEERSLYGFSVYTTGFYSGRLLNGAVAAANHGGAIGRLPIHPLLMQYGDILFADLRTAVDHERRSVSKLGALEVHPQSVFFAPKQPQT